MDQAATLRRMMTDREVGQPPVRVRVHGDSVDVTQVSDLLNQGMSFLDQDDKSNFVIVNSSGDVSEADGEAHHEQNDQGQDFSLWVISPQKNSMALAANHFLSMTRQNKGLVKTLVIVNQVTDGRQAWLTYREVESVLPSDLSRPIYLGHLTQTRQFISIANSATDLLDLNRELELCVGLLCKRLVSVARSGYQNFHGENRSQGAR